MALLMEGLEAAAAAATRPGFRAGAVRLVLDEAEPWQHGREGPGVDLSSIVCFSEVGETGARRSHWRQDGLTTEARSRLKRSCAGKPNAAVGARHLQKAAASTAESAEFALIEAEKTALSGRDLVHKALDVRPGIRTRGVKRPGRREHAMIIDSR